MRMKFDRMELSGSLGDLGTLLPIAMGMILINRLDACGVLFCIGAFYIISGLYFKVTSPVQPMKVIGAYALATGLAPTQIAASGLMIGVLLLVIGATGAINLIAKYIPKPAVRGVQLSTGALLMAKGVAFMTGTSSFQSLGQAAEPFLAVQSLGPIPIGIIIGVLAGGLTFLLLNNQRFPAGLTVVVLGFVLGIVMGNGKALDQLGLGLSLPGFLPFGLPAKVDWGLALITLVLPQIPMTIGNAVIADADLAKEYFGEDAKRVTSRKLCYAMGLANLGTFIFGGMPLCTGAGGLAAHYRFGARTAGSNLMIGALFLALALFLGEKAVALFSLLPLAVLGVLLLFAGAQLCLTISDIKESKGLFVCILILGITLATNLAAGFVVGVLAAWALKWHKLSV